MVAIYFKLHVGFRVCLSSVSSRILIKTYNLHNTNPDTYKTAYIKLHVLLF